MGNDAYDVVVIGEGIAGLTAARALAAAGARTATLEAQLFGGLVVNVNELDPSPASPGISGAEYAASLMEVNAEAGVESIQEPVTALRRTADGLEVVTAEAVRSARQVIVASGARLKKLDVPGEAEFEGRGVSQCADCDGPMYQGEDVVVVGSGDSALQEALVLARYCRRVHLLQRGERLHAQPRFLELAAKEAKIVPIRNATVERIVGADMVERVALRHADGRCEELACAGVFAYVGLSPNSGFLPPEVERDSAGYVRTSEALETTAPGVWAIGAVRSGYGGLLAQAIEEATRAAKLVRQRLPI